MDRIRIGKIVKAHALKGEFKIYPLTSDISAFKKYKKVYLENGQQYTLQYTKEIKNLLLGKFEGLDKIEDIQGLLGKYIFIEYSQKRDMQEDEYLVSELIGLEVYEHDTYIGKVEDVLLYSANDVFRIHSESGERLIPNVKEFIKKIDMENKKMYVELIEGL